MRVETAAYGITNLVNELDKSQSQMLTRELYRYIIIMPQLQVIYLFIFHSDMTESMELCSCIDLVAVRFIDFIFYANVLIFLIV